MNRRGLFGALAGGFAAAVGLRRLGALPRLQPGDRSPLGSGEATFFDDRGKAVPLDRVAAIVGATRGRTDLMLQRASIAAEPTVDVTADLAPTAPADLPPVWPGHSGEIAATASLSPLLQLERLIDLFGRSGDAAPSFAAALVGELVLTRMRLAAADPRTLLTFSADLP